MHVPKASARVKLQEPVCKKRADFIAKLKKRIQVPLARLPSVSEDAADTYVEGAIEVSKNFLTDKV